MDNSAECEERVRDGLTTAIGGPETGPALAGRLSLACVDLLDVHGVGLWRMAGGTAPVPFSTCGAVTVALDRLQIATGEGPCWEAMRSLTLFSVPDLRTADPGRWPAFTSAALHLGIQAVFAVPVTVADAVTGVLYLCRNRPGGLTQEALSGAFLAAELAALPLLDHYQHAAAPVEDRPPAAARGDAQWTTRFDVYQAVGMVTAQLDVHAAEAMLRLRAYAFAHDLTPSQVAFLIIERRLHLEDDRASTDSHHEHEEWPDAGS